MPIHLDGVKLHLSKFCLSQLCLQLRPKKFGSIGPRRRPRQREEDVEERSIGLKQGRIHSGCINVSASLDCPYIKQLSV